MEVNGQFQDPAALPPPVPIRYRAERSLESVRMRWLTDKFHAPAGLDVRGFESRQRVGIFFFTTASRQALRPTQPSIQWVPMSISLGVKRPVRETDHSPPFNAEVKNAWIYASTPQYTFMAWCSVKSTGTTLTLYVVFSAFWECRNIDAMWVTSEHYEMEAVRREKSQSAELHGVKTQETATWIFTTVTIWVTLRLTVGQSVSPSWQPQFLQNLTISRIPRKHIASPLQRTVG
jgi:hypothetical protein